MPGKRGEAVRALARGVLDDAVTLDESADPAALTEALTGLPGIGPWTAHYVAMRALGEPDGFPAGDLGLEQAAPGIDLRARAEAWRPWRSYAAVHLWAGLND